MSEHDAGEFHEREYRVLKDRTSLVFEWHGGAYIEVGRIMRPPSEVINVWNPATDQPMIPRTKKAMADHIDRWIREYPEESLIHDIRNNW